MAIHNAKRYVEDPLAKSLKICKAEIQEVMASIDLLRTANQSADVHKNILNTLLSLLIYQRILEEFYEHPCLQVSRVIDFEYGKNL